MSWQKIKVVEILITHHSFVNSSISCCKLVPGIGINHFSSGLCFVVATRATCNGWSRTFVLGHARKFRVVWVPQFSQVTYSLRLSADIPTKMKQQIFVN